MIFALITLISALLISCVAAYYSIIGLTALFSGAVIAVLIMGISLEMGKIVTATWLHKNWKKSPILLKVYLTIAVLILMLITSMGIFGFLSKAHITQNGSLLETQNKIAKLDFEIQQENNIISQEQKKIVASQKVIDQLDKSMELYFERGIIRRALREREKQINERQEMQKNIDNSNIEIKKINDKISELTIKKFNLEQQIKNFEIEVGPIKYIADLLYGEENSKNLLDQTIRIVILILIFVFDPLAILLIIAANISFEEYYKNKKTKDTASSISTKDVENLLQSVDEQKNSKKHVLAVPAIEANKNQQQTNAEKPEKEIIYKPLEPNKEQIDKIAQTVLEKASESPLVPYNLSTNEISNVIKNIISETITEELKIKD